MTRVEEGATNSVSSVPTELGCLQSARLAQPEAVIESRPIRTPPSFELAPGQTWMKPVTVHSLSAEFASSSMPIPPSYTLIENLPAPAAVTEQGEPADADRGCKPTTQVVSMPRPSHATLPSQPLRAVELSPAPGYRITELQLPDAYRSLLEADALGREASQPMEPENGRGMTPSAPETAAAVAASPRQRSQVLSLNAPLQFNGSQALVDRASPSASVVESIAALTELEAIPLEPPVQGSRPPSDNPADDEDDQEIIDEIVESLSINVPQKPRLERLAKPTWISEIRFPMLRYARHNELSLEEAIHTAIQFAPEIEVLRSEVGINQAEVVRQQAGFDWNRFVEANWDENNTPVGSDLAGVKDRLVNHDLATAYGLRRLNQFGGQLQLAQDLGLSDSNSRFFNPLNQANAKLALEYQQPLLQGGGLLVNRSLISIAITDVEASQEEFLAGLQSHVLNVVKDYWALVARRGEYIVLKNSYERALTTATIVADRTRLDVDPVQSARAEATLAARRTAVLQAEYQIVFAQERLLRLIFGPRFEESVDSEIIPISNMLGPIREVDMNLELQVGLQNRPELRRTLQSIKRASIEKGVAENQLLPLLGLSLSMSNQGLEGNRGLAGAFNDQWNLGDTSYGIGLTYVMPIGNRAAKAGLRQSQLRLTQFQKEFEQVISDVALEVRNASHNITLTGQERRISSDAMALAESELLALQQRAQMLMGVNQIGPLYLDDLLQTQERLATAELKYLNASTSYALAHFELQRATGSLLKSAPLPVEAAAVQMWSHRPAGSFAPKGQNALPLPAE